MDAPNSKQTEKITPPQGTAGVTAFTEAQIAAIGGVVQGMLDKALRSKDRPSEGDESGPPGDGGSGETGECDKEKGTWGRLLKIA